MRLFVALDLPAAARAALAAWADAAAPAAVRRVAQDDLHVTLAFLGSRDAHHAAATGALLGAVARPLATLRTAAPELGFAPPALTLYCSHTGPGGARYEPLARVAIG